MQLDRIHRFGWGIALSLLVALISVGAFILYFTPGWPRTAVGWGIALLLGFVTFAVAEVLGGGLVEGALARPEESESRISLAELESGRAARRRAKRFAVRALAVVMGVIVAVSVFWFCAWLLEIPYVRAQFG